mmetsp:Transcript_8202/g.20324  ORF Transcript_8202/g.20324 Transcript_8202/m.20324 type:complete len:81 (+) Transcript_8202:15-257(+)
MHFPVFECLASCCCVLQIDEHKLFNAVIFYLLNSVEVHVTALVFNTMATANDTHLSEREFLLKNYEKKCWVFEYGYAYRQ